MITGLSMAISMLRFTTNYWSFRIFSYQRCALSQATNVHLPGWAPPVLKLLREQPKSVAVPALVDLDLGGGSWMGRMEEPPWCGGGFIVGGDHWMIGLWMVNGWFMLGERLIGWLMVSGWWMVYLLNLTRGKSKSCLARCKACTS